MNESNLHDYQRYASDFIMTHDAVGLLLDCGLGKTVATLTAVNRLMYEEMEIDRVLVIAPKRVAEDTWTKEAQKWDHLKHLRVVCRIGVRKCKDRGVKGQSGRLRNQPGERRVAGRVLWRSMAVRYGRDRRTVELQIGKSDPV